MTLRQIGSDRLTENIVSMISLKGLEYLLNFILFPYLVRTLGIERFGAIAFMQGIMQYYIIITDYGFNMTAPKDISRADNEKEIGVIFSATLCIKLFFFSILTFLTLCFFVGAKGVFTIDVALFWMVYMMVVGNVTFPVWFFQGIQQMRYITLINVAARLRTSGLVFLFVKAPEDYLLAAFFQAGTTVFAGVFAFGILLKYFRYIFVVPTLADLKETLAGGWHIFTSTLAINIYTTTNVVVLGLLTNNMVVGYFSAANKLIDCVKGVMNAIMQAVYPHVSKKIKVSEKEALHFLKKFLQYYGAICACFSAGLFIFAGVIINLLYGKGYEESITILRIMALLPLVISVSNVYGIQLMLNWNRQKVFSRFLLTAAVLNFILVFPLIKLFSGIGAAITMVLAELFITVCTVLYVHKIMKLSLFQE